MRYDPGFAIELTDDPLGFTFGADVAHPPLELRRLDDVRASLRDPSADGPDVLYAIAMDTGPAEDRAAQVEQNILFGVCAYAAGLVGDEPVRSQGHVHAVSASCGTSTGELYEFWHGTGIVYMQEFAADDPGRGFAVRASAAHRMVVPPGLSATDISAASTIAKAIRSLMEPPGLPRSDLIQTWALAPRMRLMRMAGVLPMVCRMLSVFMGAPKKGAKSMVRIVAQSFLLATI